MRDSDKPFTQISALEGPVSLLYFGGMCRAICFLRIIRAFVFSGRVLSPAGFLTRVKGGKALSQLPPITTRVGDYIKAPP